MPSSLAPLLWFAAIIALIPIALWLLKRTPVGGMAAHGVLRSVAVLPLSPSQRIVTVEVGHGDERRWLVLGVTPQSITTLHDMPPQGDALPADAPQAPHALRAAAAALAPREAHPVSSDALRTGTLRMGGARRPLIGRARRALAQAAGGASLPLLIGQGAGGTSYSVPIQTLLFFTALSFLPAVLLLMTGFTRIVIVLSLLRQALGTQAAPPNQVIVGLSLFLTFFVMGPTLDKVYAEAYQPYSENRIAFDEALKRGEPPLREFMLKQTRQTDVMLFAKLAKLDPAGEVGRRAVQGAGAGLRDERAEERVPDRLPDLHSLSRHRHDRRQRADEPGDDDAQPGARRPALQADAVRAGRRLEPAARVRWPRASPPGAPKDSPWTRKQVFTFGQQGLYLLLMVAAPVLLTVLVVGLVVSIFQAATQIHEATLSFVPKMIAAVAVLMHRRAVDARHAGRVPAADAAGDPVRRQLSARRQRCPPRCATRLPC